MPAVKNESPTPAAPKPEAERTVLVVVKPFTHAALSGEKGGFSLMPGQAFTGRQAEDVVKEMTFSDYLKFVGKTAK